MKKLRDIIFCVVAQCLALEIIAKNNAPLLISIGHDCGVALQLRRFNLREIALPFDWITTFDFWDLYKMINEDFKNFLVPNYLSYQGIFIQDYYYKIKFFHDFPVTSRPNQPIQDDKEMGTIVGDWQKYINEVKEKYNRRIARFNHILTSASRDVIFLRTYYITPKQAQIFVKLITKKYPGLKFTLVAIHDKLEFNYDWGIKNVRNFYFTQRDPNNGNIRWLDSEWIRAFKILNFMK